MTNLCIKKQRHHFANKGPYSQFSSVQSLSRVRLLATPWTVARQASLSITNSRSLLKLMSIESVIPSNNLILWCPFPSCPQSFPESGSFPMSWLFISGGQTIGASASVSIFPMNIQGWFPLGLTGLIFCCPKDSWVFLSTTIQKYQFFGAQLSLWSNSHLYTWLLKKRIFDYIDLCRQSVVCFLIQCLGLS